MKIALLGYGKMGRMIETIAQERGHTVVLRIDADNRESLTAEMLREADVTIEFSTPSSVLDNIKFCLEAGVPVVVGTTGWQQSLDDVMAQVQATNGGLVHASNFSLGVNMLFALNEKLAGWMSKFPEYKPVIEEVHHTHKLDAPSGTAISLADGILHNHNDYTGWSLHEEGGPINTETGKVPIIYDRIDGVPGIHDVTYTSDIDKIYIGHSAFSRQGFALGAVLAAEFLKDRKGVFTARDIFNFN